MEEVNDGYDILSESENNLYMIYKNHLFWVMYIIMKIYQ